VSSPTVQPSNRPTACAGIDAGGSRSETVIVDAKLAVLARSAGPAAAVRRDNVAAVSQVLAAGLQEALAAAGRPAVEALVVGAAGAGRPAERHALEAALRERQVARRIRVIGDGEIALESAFGETAGILLIAGTGSIAYARDRAGTVRRVGGLGWQLGDEGSGYALGREGLAAAGRAAEGRGPATLLLDLILRHTDSPALDGLVDWAQAAQRNDVARLAPLVCDAAREGDLVAQELIEKAAADLAAHVETLMRRITPDTPEGIALTGGLLTQDALFRSRTIAALERVAPRIPVIQRTVDPALGAAALALRL
jgi:glucosamine kinase